MKKMFSFLLVLQIGTFLFAQGIEIPVRQKECAEQIIQHYGYSVSYNEDLLIPNWVAYELTSDKVNGQFPRKGAFCPDPKVRGRSATTYDYTNSGWDRGHMAPAADLKWSEQSMRESFYLSNICPQNRKLNSGAWLELEDAVREWALKHDELFIVCGPIMGVVYDTIGVNGVAIPKAFYKVICKKIKGVYFAIGFVFPNENVTGNIYDYTKSVDDVEIITGFDFFSLLPDEIENKMESEYQISNWTR